MVLQRNRNPLDRKMKKKRKRKIMKNKDYGIKVQKKFGVFQVIHGVM